MSHLFEYRYYNFLTLTVSAKSIEKDQASHHRRAQNRETGPAINMFVWGPLVQLNWFIYTFTLLKYVIFINVQIKSQLSVIANCNFPVHFRLYVAWIKWSIFCGSWKTERHLANNSLDV